MTSRNKDDSAWDEASWKGHRLAQHRAFLRLSFPDKLKAVEAMGDFAREMLENRRDRGRPGIDPETDGLARGSQSEQVGEDPKPYPTSRKS